MKVLEEAESESEDENEEERAWSTLIISITPLIPLSDLRDRSPGICGRGAGRDGGCVSFQGRAGWAERPGWWAGGELESDLDGRGRLLG